MVHTKVIELLIGGMVGAGMLGVLIGGIFVAMSKRNIQTIEGCKNERDNFHKTICSKIDTVKTEINNLKEGQSAVFDKFDKLDTKLGDILTFVGRVEEFMNQTGKRSG